MKKLFLNFALMIAIPIFLPQTAAAAIGSKNLIKGQSVTLTLDYSVGDVAITDDQICDFIIREGRKEIYLNPRKAGSTRMTLWDGDGKKRDEFSIQVQDITSDAIYEEARQKFSHLKDVKIDFNSGWVVFSGKVGSRYEHRQVQEFAQKYPQVENDVRLDAAVVETMIQRIEKEIGIPGVKVRQVRNQLLLEGLVYSKELYKKAETIARLYAPEVVNLIEVREGSRRPGKDRLVQIDIHLMEIKKSAVRNIGISWNPGATLDGRGTGLVDAFRNLIGTVTNLLPKINLMRQSGSGRVLDNPQLLVKSGEKANFFSGTTIPFRGERVIEFKDAGVTIEASPIATASNDVDLQVKVELSSIASISSTKDVGIDRNTLETTVYCPAGKSAVLGGIIRNQDNRTFNKPTGGSDSALFALAASKDFQSNQSEFFIFLTPTILQEPRPAERRLEEWLDLEAEVVRDRSKKEFGEYLLKQTEGRP